MTGIYCHSGHCRTARRVAAALTLSPRLLRSGALLVSTSPVSLKPRSGRPGGVGSVPTHKGARCGSVDAFMAPAGTSPARPTENAPAPLPRGGAGPSARVGHPRMAATNTKPTEIQTTGPSWKLIEQ
jgi:hypothetical protein